LRICKQSEENLCEITVVFSRPKQKCQQRFFLCLLWRALLLWRRFTELLAFGFCLHFFSHSRQGCSKSSCNIVLLARFITWKNHNLVTSEKAVHYFRS